MINFLLSVLQVLWRILEDASVYLLFGFLIAGVLAVLVPRQLLTRLIGTGKIRSVLWGSVLGAPLPLCSCGVLPTAVGLRKEGRDAGGDGRVPGRDPRNWGGQHQPDLRADRPVDDRVPAHCRGPYRHRRRHPHEPVRRDAASAGEGDERARHEDHADDMAIRTSMAIGTYHPHDMTTSMGSPLRSSRSSPAGRQGWSWVR